MGTSTTTCTDSGHNPRPGIWEHRCPTCGLFWSFATTKGLVMGGSGNIRLNGATTDGVE